MNKISIEELSDFLEESNKSTYANKDAPRTDSTRLKSEDYHFEKGNLIYHDTYFGGRDFIGGEIVYKDKEPVWGMNYYGYILFPEIKENELYAFLREALMQEFEDILPIRGPKSFENVSWKYANLPIGELGRFTGKEEIYRDGKLVYVADYHGGFIE